MDVRVTKVNCGITFAIMRTENSKTKERFVTRTSKRRDKAVRDLVAKTISLYSEEVLAVLKQHDLPTSDFLRAVCEVRYSDQGAVLELEPWGYAHGTFENPEMGDTGSVSTPRRAKMLLAYQAPLAKTSRPDGTYEYTKVYRV